MHKPELHSEKGELFTDLSSSEKSLFSGCEDWNSRKSKNFNLTKCILANSFFQLTDKIVTSVTHRAYSCTKY